MTNDEERRYLQLLCGRFLTRKDSYVTGLTEFLFFLLHDGYEALVGQISDNNKRVIMLK
jgi:hypothetical protein